MAATIIMFFVLIHTSTLNKTFITRNVNIMISTIIIFNFILYQLDNIKRKVGLTSHKPIRKCT